MAGFSPFFVVQYVVAFLVAVVFRLNKLLVLAGLCINLPWIMVPWYTATTAIAGALLGVPLPADLRGEFVSLFSQSVLSWAFLRHLFGFVRPWVVPFIVGPTIGAIPTRQPVQHKSHDVVDRDRDSGIMQIDRHFQAAAIRG